MATNRLRSKVRLVKCPKCLKILPEPEHVPLYTCGGCGTTLQAKYYTDENRGTTLESHQINGGESNEGQRSNFDGGLLSDRNDGNDQNATSSARVNSPLSESVSPETDANIEADSKSERPILTDSVLSPKEDDLRPQQSTNEASPTNPSRVNGSQVIKSKEQLQFGDDYSLLVNTEVSDDKNHGENVNSVREASSSNKSLVSENEETVHNESNHCAVLGETQNEPHEIKLSNGKNSAEDRDMKEIANVANKEIHGINIEDDSIDHIRQKLGSITLNEVSSSTDISTARTEANLRAFRDGGEMDSLTKGSLAPDESVSSLEGNEDQVMEQQEDPQIRGFRNQHKRYSQINEESIEAKTVPLGNRTMRKNRDGFLVRAPPYRSSELVYETDSSSSYRHDNLHNDRQHYRYEDSEPWVHRSYAQGRSMEYRRRVSEASWRENEHLPTYYDNHATYRRREESRSFSGHLPRLNYSAEMFDGGRRYEVRDPYRWSSQLRGPPPPHQSFSWDPTSPQRFAEPSGTYPWLPPDVAYVADESQRHRNEILRRSYLREKRQAMKRHFHSLAGGAPFVTCYFCFTVVRLPEDFLLRRQRATTHRVKCGVCLNTLEYSLENGSCLTPRMPNPDLGASEGGEINASTNDSGNVGSKNLTNDGGSRSTNVKWKVPSRRSKSPLHRLMGYSSPYNIFNGEADPSVDW